MGDGGRGGGVVVGGGGLECRDGTVVGTATVVSSTNTRSALRRSAQVLCDTMRTGLDTGDDCEAEVEQHEPAKQPMVEIIKTRRGRSASLDCRIIFIVRSETKLS